MLVGGLVVAVGAPLSAALTSRFDRRLLLAASLAHYAVGHASSALVGSFGALLALRAITVVGAAVFTPQAAATAGLLVPPDGRARAIATIFIGWSLASVLGIPLGTWLAATLDWRLVYAGMGLFSALGAVLVWITVPGGLRVPPLDLAAWRATFTSPVLLLVLSVTVLSMSGQFTLVSYLAPILADGYGATPLLISLGFALSGLAGVAGNAIAARLATPLGTDRVIALALGLLIAGFAVLTLTFGIVAGFILAALLWGLGSFSSNSLQQGRLIALAPALASATVALNTSAVYLGQAIGSATGGAIIARGISPGFGLAALGFALAALIASLLATRLARHRANRSAATQ